MLFCRACDSWVKAGKLHALVVPEPVISEMNTFEQVGIVRSRQCDYDYVRKMDSYEFVQ